MRYILLLSFLFSQQLVHAQIDSLLCIEWHKMDRKQIRATGKAIEKIVEAEAKKERFELRNSLHQERLYTKNLKLYLEYKQDSMVTVHKQQIKVYDKQFKILKKTNQASLKSARIAKRKTENVLKEKRKIEKEYTRLQKAKNRYLYGIIILIVLIGLFFIYKQFKF